MKRILPLLAGVMLIGLMSLSAQSQLAYSKSAGKTDKAIPSFTDSEVVTRLKKMPCKMLSPRFNSIVKSYINTYVVRGRARTEKMLGRTAMYFPIFEKYLLENDLPIDLRCLPIVESALQPKAVSRSKAVGLWQFMPATGKECGLRNNKYVDERMDPYRATEAAVGYLKRLYNRYDDWALALAAYNGGPGKVNRAIRKANSKDFWRIRHYLPVETQNYVPAFIAALYLWNYFHLHGLNPSYPELELQMTDVIKIYKYLPLKKVAEITGLPLETITLLNPSYKRGAIPQSTAGYNLILPRSVIAKMYNDLKHPDKANMLVSTFIPAPGTVEGQVFKDYSGMFKTTYTVSEGDDLKYLAELFNCTTSEIKAWNALANDNLQAGKELILFRPKPEREKVKASFKLPAKDISSIQPIEPSKTRKESVNPMVFKEDDRFVYHYLKAGESLMDILRIYPEVTLTEILELNKKKLKEFKPGDRVVVMKK